MMRFWVCAIAAIVSLSAITVNVKAEDANAASAAATVPGWHLQQGTWVPDEPFVAGQPRATGLQAPFPPMRALDKNPMTPEKVELGKLLFFDPLLSGANTISCAHCHHPDYGFADGRKLSMGYGGEGVGPERSGGKELGARAEPVERRLSQVAVLGRPCR